MGFAYVGEEVGGAVSLYYQNGKCGDQISKSTHGDLRGAAARLARLCRQLFDAQEKIDGRGTAECQLNKGSCHTGF